VHRDVKPGNILVAGTPADETAYICDFGLARHMSTASSLTGDRGFVGTIDYVPPEQIAGRPLDRRADVYSLGCVLYECLTGGRPFEHESELALIYAHLNDAPPRVTDLSPELPAALDDVIAAALAKEPDDRYASCGELVAAAQAALTGRASRRRSRGRHRWLIVAAGALVAAAAAVVAYLVVRDDEPAPPPAPAAITQTSIGGASLGGTKAVYTSRFGAYKQLSLTEFPPPIPGVSFGQPQVAVYFKADPKHGDIITTWNRRFRTAAGVGPCSTIAELKRAYGDAVHPSPHSISPDGNRIGAYVVGRNLLFSTQDQRTISVVALYRGAAINTRKSDQQAWANFVAAVETPCV